MQEGYGVKLKRFLKECQRVLKILYKPDKQEFRMSVKISGLGLGILGAMGFLIFLLNQIIF